MSLQLWSQAWDVPAIRYPAWLARRVDESPVDLGVCQHDVFQNDCLFKHTRYRTLLDYPGLYSQPIIQDSRSLVINLYAGDVKPVPSRHRACEVESDSFKEFVACKLQVVQIVRVVYMTVGIALVGANHKLCFV